MRCATTPTRSLFSMRAINIEGLRADVTARAYQGGVQSQSPSSGGLAVSHDVRRILEAAAAAARGSRRRDINGAIVLAAIVGDARSMAAEILQAHGLNFDNAIRALQTALAPVRDVPAQVPVADDVLARARERVQSRSAPSLRDMMKDMPGWRRRSRLLCLRLPKKWKRRLQHWQRRRRQPRRHLHQCRQARGRQR